MRRDPTRIETKLEDIKEYEQMQRQMEMKQNKTITEDAGSTSSPEVTTKTDITGRIGQNRTEMIQQRIGYEPEEPRIPRGVRAPRART